MTSGTWLALVVFGGFVMWIVYQWRKPLIQALLVRTHAILFLAAGVIGSAARGWAGDFTRWLTGKINELGGALSSEVFGTPILVGLFVIILTALLILTFLPEKWFRRSIPDWLSLAGLLLPGLAASAPGPLGESVRALYRTVGIPVAEIVKSGIS